VIIGLFCGFWRKQRKQFLQTENYYFCIMYVEEEVEVKEIKLKLKSF